jgi:GT2 family glycosyltransferase
MMQELVKIDIIILSYAKNEKLKKLTEQTITTLLTSEDQAEIQFNIVVIESNQALKPYQFNHSRTIYPDTEFGFNKYLNIGIKATDNPYICLCNNDLIFHKNWAKEILELMASDKAILSAAPFCPVTHVRDGYPFNEKYLPIYHIFSGWCFLIKRELLNTIGLFDEQYKFWYADADYLNTLKRFDIKNYMVTSSKVTHLGSQTSDGLPPKLYKKLTAIPNTYHNYKWRKDSYVYYILKKLYLQTLIKLNII